MCKIFRKFLLLKKIWTLETKYKRLDNSEYKLINIRIVDEMNPLKMIHSIEKENEMIKSFLKNRNKFEEILIKY